MKVILDFGYPYFWFFSNLILELDAYKEYVKSDTFCHFFHLFDSLILKSIKLNRMNLNYNILLIC